MDITAYYLLSAIFISAFISETLVTGKLFMHRENLPVTGIMRWWAILSLGGLSVVNILGFLRLRSNYYNETIDLGNYLQATFALFGLSLVAWVWVFHLERWQKN